MHRRRGQATIFSGGRLLGLMRSAAHAIADAGNASATMPRRFFSGVLYSTHLMAAVGISAMLRALYRYRLIIRRAEMMAIAA